MTHIFLYKKMVLGTGVVIACLLAACGSNAEPAGLPTSVAPIATFAPDVATATPLPVATVAPTEPPTPTELPAPTDAPQMASAESPLLATADLTSSADFSGTALVSPSVEARVFFRQPTADAILPLTSTVSIGVEGLVVEPAGDVKEGSGHLHILIDSDFIAAGNPIPKDSQHIHLGSGALVTDVVLAPGPHILRLQFADGAHMALDGEQYRAEIQVEVKADAPAQSVRFVTPAEGATVSSPFTVTMAATGLIVEPAGEVQADVGHLHILIDSDFIAAGDAIPKDETHLHFGKGQLVASLTLAPGKHTLRLQFADGAHVALDGEQYRAELSVNVK